MTKDCSKTCINSNRNGLKYNISEERLENLRKSTCNNLLKISYNKMLKNKNNYDSSPNLCQNCLKMIEYSKRKLKFCNKECRFLFRRKDKNILSRLSELAIFWLFIKCVLL